MKLTFQLFVLLPALLCPALWAAASTPPGKASAKAAKLVLSPIQIDEIHDAETSVGGFSPVPAVALSVKVNGVAGVSTANANAAGRFAIVLPQKAQAGNFVEVSGTAPNGAALYGSTTVTAGASGGSAAKKLSKPAIGALAEGGSPVITVTQNSADSAVAGLSLHVRVLSKTDAAKVVWEGDCPPDAKSGSCQVTPNPPTLSSGQVVEATERLVAGGKTTSSEPVDVTVSAAQGLGTPTVAAAEGTRFVFVTPDKADAGKRGLRIVATVFRTDGTSTGNTQGCEPDAAGDKCRIDFTNVLQDGWRVDAFEQTASFSGSHVVAEVTPIEPLGRPTLATPHQGDKTISVTLNSSDMLTVKAPAHLNAAIRVKVPTTPGDKGAGQGEAISAPCDADGHCKITLADPLVEGQIVRAWEAIADTESKEPRASDGAVEVAVVNDVLSVPTIAKVRESATSATIRLNDGDLKKFPGGLSVAADVYDGDSPVPGQSDTCAPDSKKNSCTVTFTALAAGQTIHAREVPGADATRAPSVSGPETVVPVEEQGYNWGRIRAYFSLGTVFSRNTISAPTATSPASQTASNFSSPEAFAAFDMEFTWFTRQACLAASYVSKPVKLATLADATSQCEWSAGLGRVTAFGGRNMANAGADAREGLRVTAVKRLRAAIGSASDPGTVATLSMLMRFYSADISENVALDETLARLSPILNRFPDDTCGAADAECAQKLKAALSLLTSIELTPTEARQILSSNNGFETRRHWGYLVNSYFESKLTQTAASNGFTLATSSNSVHVEGGAYVPVYFPWSRWTYQHQPYALFVAPIAKIGFDSLRSSATDQLGTVPNPAGTSHFDIAANALSRDVFRMVTAGTRLGFLGLSASPSRAPDLVSYIDITYGRFDNYFAPKYNDTAGGVRYPLRLNIKGLFKVPSTPLYVGMDLNKGVGPDNLAIFIGLRTDLASLLSKLVTIPPSQ